MSLRRGLLRGRKARESVLAEGQVNVSPRPFLVSLSRRESVKLLTLASW